MATVTEMPANYAVRDEPIAAPPSEPVTPLMRACQQDDLDQAQNILSKHVSTRQQDRKCPDDI